MNKEYLNMADVFRDQVQPERFNYALCSGKAKYAAHAINSHDELVAEVERLREHLKLCATELSWMIDKHNVQSMEDGSWLYDHQTPWEAMQLID